MGDKKIQFEGYINSYLENHLAENRLSKEYFNLGFYDYLLEQVQNNSIKTLLTIFWAFKKEQLLIGDVPKERYENFAQYSLTEEFHELVDKMYPLLKPRLNKILQNHIINYNDLKSRVGKDKDEIDKKFGFSIGDIKDCNITYGVSDYHRGLKSVCIIEVDNKKIIYKPRSGKIDISWSNFINWFNSKGLSLKIDTIKTLDKEEYHWQEYIDNKSCKSKLEIQNLYYRMGILAAISYAFRIEDLHMENIIVSGEFPHIIDLETIFQLDGFQKSNLEVKTVSDIINKKISESVLSTQLFPTPSKFHDSEVDISGIVGQGKQIIKNGKVKISNQFTDAVEVIREDGIMARKSNIGQIEDNFINPKDYIKEIIEGFKEGYILLKDNKEELLGLINSGELFKGISPRYLFRNTNLYAIILEMSRNPKYLKNKSDLDRLYHLLFNTDKDYILKKVYQSELVDLLNDDIPYFYGYINDNTVYNSNGDDCFILKQTPLMAVNERIKNLNQEDLNIQIDFILKSMAKPKKTWNTVRNKSDDNIIKYIDNNNQLVIESAIKIGDMLISKAVFHERTKTINWLDIQNTFPTWTIGSQGVSLYNGLAGNAIFFSSLYLATVDIRYKEILYKILNTIKLDVGNIKNIPPSAFNGMISIAYLYAFLYKQIGYKNMLEESVDIVKKYKAKILQNISYDIIDGLAGILVVILNIFELSQDRELEHLSIEVGKDIISNIKIEGKSAYWKKGSNNELMISGFSHGLAGVSYALGKLYKMTNYKESIYIVDNLIKIENNYYNSDIENWMDLRSQGDLSINDSPIHWCHGATGIGLSRLKNKDFIDTFDDIDKALKAVKKNGLYRDSDCLCHGNLGNMELLLEVYKENNDIDLYNQAIIKANEIIKRNEGSQEYKSGVGQEFNSPNFMLGLSGMGYEFLRLSNPKKYPSVLLLEV
ncbi:type 2 lanthipeptide synthetase LanM [Tissierella sp. MB52-C2]|uniref:type 2 lanthipeptide synthetase LanM n=1 Tax=Tissierella sp. MB52-C2 TaxID=3070999 RepID=UPI00280B63AC|nr:type 2 lanthipeptide synthetase LanM [Tissierella sp. MB52-C2]WMM26147.1 type 2 lanthipeptide synthetase LanM [Tissierella sp. MB52-C2]